MKRGLVTGYMGGGGGGGGGDRELAPRGMVAGIS